MTTELKFKQVEEDLNKYSEEIQYELDENSHITFRPYFSQTEILKMVYELNKVEIDKLPDNLFMDFVLFHIIKHFTVLGDQLEATDLSGQLLELETIVNMEYNGVSLFKLIIEEMFLPEQIKKVHDFLLDKLAETELTKRMVEQSIKTMQEIGIDNDEIKMINLLGK